jgi:hypothetical protein
MRATMTGNPMLAIRATVRLVRAAPGPVRLCRVLVDAWLRRLERRIEDDLRWFDHDGVSDDFRPASRRVAERPAATQATDPAGVRPPHGGSGRTVTGSGSIGSSGASRRQVVDNPLDLLAPIR